MENQIEIYEEIVCAISTRIGHLSKEQGEINIINFDKKNTDHLLFLNCAFVANTIFNLNGINLKTNLFNFLKLKKKYRFSNLKRIKKRHLKKEKNYIDFDELINYFYPRCKKLLGENFTFFEIYDIFYNVK